MPDQVRHDNLFHHQPRRLVVEVDCQLTGEPANQLTDRFLPFGGLCAIFAN